MSDEALRRISESMPTSKPAGASVIVDSGISARDYVDGVEVRDLIAEAKDRAKLAQRAGMASEEISDHRSLAGMQHQSAASTDDEDEYDPEGPGRDVVEQASEEIASGLSIVTLRDFKAAARSLKAAELAFRDAQQVYAEAVKRLSEEAVK